MKPMKQVQLYIDPERYSAQRGVATRAKLSWAAWVRRQLDEAEVRAARMKRITDMICIEDAGLITKLAGLESPKPTVKK